MHIAEVVTIAKSLPLLRLNTYKSLILSYSADYRRILQEKHVHEFFQTCTTFFENTYVFQHKHHDIFTMLIINTLNKVFDYWLIVVFSVKKSFSR